MIPGGISACDKLGDGYMCVCACTGAIQRMEDKDAATYPTK